MTRVPQPIGIEKFWWHHKKVGLQLELGQIRRLQMNFNQSVSAADPDWKIVNIRHMHNMYELL